MPYVNELEEIDNDSIKMMSFVPNKDTRTKLINISNKLTNKLTNITKDESVKQYLSKTPKIIPDSYKPQDTILVKLGKKETIGNKYFKVINDRNIPFYGKSNGPNGVLVEFDNEYGINRVNLFYESEKETCKLLNDYLTMRNENINEIFNMFVEKLKLHLHNKDTDVDYNKLTDPQKTDYTNVVNMFTNINDKIKNNMKLEELGIGVVSFCQTWARRINGVDEVNEEKPQPQFSIMSPHFQTRFYVKNQSNIIGKASITLEERKSYVNMIKEFNKLMKQDYEGAFVNLDELQIELQKECNQKGGGSKRRVKKSGRKTKKSKKSSKSHRKSHPKHKSITKKKTTKKKTTKKKTTKKKTTKKKTTKKKTTKKKKKMVKKSVRKQNNKRNNF